MGESKGRPPRLEVCDARALPTIRAALERVRQKRDLRRAGQADGRSESKGEADQRKLVGKPETFSPPPTPVEDAEVTGSGVRIVSKDEALKRQLAKELNQPRRLGR
jgi:hypothetical protein